MYITYQPSGNDLRAIANSDSVFIAQIFFDGKSILPNVKKLSYEIWPLVSQKGTNIVSNFEWFCACFQEFAYNDAMKTVQ